MAQVPAQWAGWEQALDLNPALRGFDEGFHNRIVQTQPGPILPLVSIVERLFGWSMPTHWYPYPLLTTQLFVDTKLLLGKRLTSGLVPILICDDCPGSATVAPWDVWPADVHVEWAEGWKPLAGS